MKTSGNHQVQNKPVVIVETYRDALSDALQASNGLSFQVLNAWCCGAKQERTPEAYSFELLTEDSQFQGFKVHNDVRQLGHAQYLVMLPSGA